MSHETLQSLHIAISVLTGAAALMIGGLLWSISTATHDSFTCLFLRTFAAVKALKTVEIGTALYRASQIPAEAVPNGAAIAGIAGRTVELVAYMVVILILLRPKTQAKLNGTSKHAFAPKAPEKN